MKNFNDRDEPLTHTKPKKMTFTTKAKTMANKIVDKCNKLLADKSVATQ